MEVSGFDYHESKNTMCQWHMLQRIFGVSFLAQIEKKNISMISSKRRITEDLVFQCKSHNN